MNTIYLFIKNGSGLQIFFPNIGRLTMGFVFIFGPIRYSGRSHDVKHFLVQNVTLQNLKSRFSSLTRQHITGVFRNLHFGRSFLEMIVFCDKTGPRTGVLQHPQHSYFPRYWVQLTAECSPMLLNENLR